MTEQVFRLRLRPLFLSFAFAFGALFAVVGVGVSRTSAGAVLTFGAAALVCVVVAWRCARMRAVADDYGITVYAELITTTVAWRDIREIRDYHGEIDGGLLTVHAPEIVKTNGRRVRIPGASSWNRSRVEGVVAGLRSVGQERFDHG